MNHPNPKYFIFLSLYLFLLFRISKRASGMSSITRKRYASVALSGALATICLAGFVGFVILLGKMTTPMAALYGAFAGTLIYAFAWSRRFHKSGHRILARIGLVLAVIAGIPFLVKGNDNSLVIGICVLVIVFYPFARMMLAFFREKA